MCVLLNSMSVLQAKDLQQIGNHLHMGVTNVISYQPCQRICIIGRFSMVAE